MASDRRYFIYSLEIAKQDAAVGPVIEYFEYSSISFVSEYTLLERVLGYLSTHDITLPNNILLTVEFPEL